MLRRLLDRQEQDLLQAERDLLQRLNLNLVSLEAAKEDRARLTQAQRQLDELFLLVIVGEFNAGKSAFINALLGRRLLEEGATPTTTRVHLLRYGSEIARTVPEANLEIITCPVEWLEEINIVDTPGTNAIIQRHQEIAEDFVPRSDLVLFVTSADRPFSESERLFLNRIRSWGKKVVIVVNKVDILDQADIPEVREFVAENAYRLLGVEPEVFMVSARLAQRAKEAKQRVANEPTAETPQSTSQPVDQLAAPPSALDLWSESRFEALEQYILETLDETERLRLKLLNPLGVARHLHVKYAEIAQARLEILADDFTTLDSVDANLKAYEEDMRSDFRYHLSHIDNVLYAMSDRGMQFFDETLRLARIFDLINSAKIREAFEREVVADTVPQIEHQIDELIDWMVDRDHRMWQAVMAYLNRRAELHSERVIGEVGGSFEFNRRELLDSVGRAAQRVVATYDHKAEAAKLADSVQMAVAQTAVMEVGALGLGAILVAALHTVVADVTGILFASTLAAVGLYVLPSRRRKAQEELRSKVAELRERLHHSLTEQFERELSLSIQRIQEAIQPYTRFVRTERDRLSAVEEDLDGIDRDLRHLEAQIEAL